MRPLFLLLAVIALLQFSLAPRRLPRDTDFDNTSPAARGQPRDPDFDTTRTADRRGEKLPPGVVARLGGRGPGGSLGAAFSPDGRLVAFVGPERDTHVWDVTTETELHRLPHDNPANFPTNNDRRTFSADGRLLFGDGGAVWDVTSGKRVARFGPFPKGFTSLLAYPTTSPDGKTLAYATTQHGHYGAEVVLYDIASRRELRRFGKDTRVQGPLAFSPDGRTLAAGKCSWELPEALGWRGRPRPPRPPEDYGGVLLFDTATGARTAEVFSKDFYGWSLVGFSPNGATLYLTDRKTITPFDVATRTPGEPFGSVSWSGAAVVPDGRAIVATYPGGALAVWGTDGKEIARVDEPRRIVYDVVLSPGGRWAATTTTDGPVLVWDVAALRAGKR
ncbi:MAG TPA: WD40 repeat domain-containing protein [Urbifossiella sp.]|nr:WD40 repeat domain-containing protein [Urbifossiella sp.]